MAEGMEGIEKRSQDPPTDGWAPLCLPSSLVLYFLSLLFLVFGVLYLAYPDTIVATTSSIGKGLGLSRVPADGAPSAFGGWLVFTFAYMVAAAASSFFAARSADPRPYLRILVVLKATSCLTAGALFVVQDPFAFYLATGITDGPLALVAVCLYVHLTGDMERLKRSGVALGGTQDGVK